VRLMPSAIAACTRFSLAAMLQYRGEIILWAVWGVIYPAVAMAMWGAALHGAPQEGGIKGFGQRDFAAYFLLTMVVGHLCTAWDIYEMGYLVRSGLLSPKLLRPILPLWTSAADNAAYKILTLAILMPIWLGVAWFVRPVFTTGWAHLLLGVPALLLAATLSFLWGYVVSLVAFWTTRTDAVAESWFGASLMLGGRMAPLALLPLPLQWAAAALPFKWIIWFPCELLMGRLSVAQAWAGLAWQAAWTVLGLVVFRLFWSAALKRYSAVGA